MPHPTRKAIARFAVTALLIVVVAYPLSYAPVVRFKVECIEKHPEFDYIRTFDGADLPIYEPIDRLIDETILQEPLFLWARLWGVEAEFEYAYLYRLIRIR